MQEVVGPDRAISAKLDRLGVLLFEKDRGIIDELRSGPPFTLIGSADGEVASTREALERLIDGLFALPAKLNWVWNERTVTRQGDVAWLFAEGHLVSTYPDRIERKPYRLVGVLQEIDSRWHWRLFSGSEPVP